MLIKKTKPKSSVISIGDLNEVRTSIIFCYILIIFSVSIFICAMIFNFSNSTIQIFAKSYQLFLLMCLAIGTIILIFPYFLIKKQKGKIILYKRNLSIQLYAPILLISIGVSQLCLISYPLQSYLRLTVYVMILLLIGLLTIFSLRKIKSLIKARSNPSQRIPPVI
jgi:hypothetical protein